MAVNRLGRHFVTLTWSASAFRTAVGGIFVLAHMGIAGCGESGQQPPQQVTDSGPTLHETRRAVEDSVAAERYTGLWTVNQLTKRLFDAGLQVTRTDSAIAHPHLAVQGKLLRLSRGDLHVFLYPDTTQARREGEKLDSATALQAGATSIWNAQPTLLRSLNLVAVFVSDNPNQAERVGNAISAGLVPPEKGK